MLLDPARIKRGLVASPPGRLPAPPGASFRVVVDDGFRDASGTPFERGPSGATRSVTTSAAAWTPAAGS